MADKEILKMCYSDLAPSLQQLIDGKVADNIYQVMKTKVLDIESRMNGITVTIGNIRPTSVVECKNLNLDTQINIPETYHDGAWHRRAVVFK